jgi:hypothetical protein
MDVVLHTGCIVVVRYRYFVGIHGSERIRGNLLTYTMCLPVQAVLLGPFSLLLCQPGMTSKTYNKAGGRTVVKMLFSSVYQFATIPGRPVTTPFP